MKNTDPFFSIVTVVFNAGLELEKTINSVSEQNINCYEYIVIDGGSRSATMDIIRRNSKSIDVFISEPDLGIYDAMNKGVALAKGKFVIFMNAGDVFYSSQSLELMLPYIVNTNADLVYGGYLLQGSMRHDGIITPLGIDEVLYGMPTSHQSMFFRRCSLSNSPFSLGYGSAGDYELLVRWYSEGRNICVVDDVIVSVFAAGGISDIYRSQSVKNAWKAIKSHNFATPFLNLFYIKLFFRAKLFEFLYYFTR